MPLNGAVTHGGQEAGQMTVAVVGATNRADSIWPRVHQFGRFALPGRNYAGTIGHLAVGKGRTVFHY